MKRFWIISLFLLLISFPVNAAMVDDFPKDIDSLPIDAKYFDDDNGIAWWISAATETRSVVGLGFRAKKIAETNTPSGKYYNIVVEANAPISYYWIDRNNDNKLMIEINGKLYYDAREVAYDEAGDGLNGNEIPWEMYPVSPKQPIDFRIFSDV